MRRAGQASSPVALLISYKGIGPEFAAVLYREGLFPILTNRRPIAAYAGLAPSPWRDAAASTTTRALSKPAIPRLRTTMVELALMWCEIPARPVLSAVGQPSRRSERGPIPPHLDLTTRPQLPLPVSDISPMVIPAVLSVKKPSFLRRAGRRITITSSTRPDQPVILSAEPSNTVAVIRRHNVDPLSRAR